MKVFEQTLIVIPDDLDDLYHVNNVRYVQWVQNIAKAHWNHAVSNSLRQKYFWVLLKHTIEYKSSAVLNDTIILKTYITKLAGVKSTRVVEMYHKDSGKLILKSEAVWCFIDADTKKPVRIHPEIMALFN